jgi:hypothetical protein
MLYPTLLLDQRFPLLPKISLLFAYATFATTDC